MLSIQMNDAAARMLGAHDGLLPVPPPGGLAAGLQELLKSGIVRRERVLTWAGSAGGAASAPSFFPDLTGWRWSQAEYWPKTCGSILTCGHALKSTTAGIVKPGGAARLSGT